MQNAVEAIFSFPPAWKIISSKAREMIMKRGREIGLTWDEESVGRMKSERDWSKLLNESTDSAITYPSYYTKPFHAYPEGNLGLDPALEVTLAAKSVHAAVMDPEGKRMDPEGDSMLRRGYSTQLLASLEELGIKQGSIKSIVDLGAATGLSSLELLQTFPGSHVTALDLSPHFLAVGKHLQMERNLGSIMQEPISFVHGLAEDTKLPSDSQDLVSICLVLHECPQQTSRAIFAEAFRILRPGGVFSIMEMDPDTPSFSRIMSNPFAYAAFKSTEPWLVEYVTLPLTEALEQAGFKKAVKRQATPRHKCIVAIKPSI